MELAINKDNFEALVAGDQPVVIDFWAEWCGPCRTMSPIVDELAAEYEGKVVIGKCDVEENDDITMKYGVRNIPTIVFLKGGELVDKQVGAASKAALAEKIEKWMESRGATEEILYLILQECNYYPPKEQAAYRQTVNGLKKLTEEEYKKRRAD